MQYEKVLFPKLKSLYLWHKVLAMKKILFLLIIFLISLKTNICAQTKDDFAAKYLFSYITVNNGLTNNFVDDIYQDSKGFVWIATVGGGLLRYDGYDFMHFNSRSKYPLKSNFVKKVVEDNFNRLWISSESGIDIMNLSNYEKSPILKENEDVSGIFSNLTIKLVKDSQGSIWASSLNSITKFDFDNEGNISRISTLRSEKRITSQITAMYEFEGQMLAGINNVVCKIIQTDKCELIAIPYSSLLKLECDDIKCMIEKENELWIGTDNGLVRFNPASETLKIYLHDENNEKSLSQNLISDLKINNKGRLVVSTLKGINFYDSMTDDFRHISQSSDENDYKSLNNDFVNTILCDDKILWIGTECGGVNKMIRPLIDIKNYQNSVSDKTSLPLGAINSVFVDSFGNLWVGQIEGGLSLKEKDKPGFQNFTTRNGLSHNSVSYISEIDENKLLLGTWGGGLTVFDKNLKRGILTVNPETLEGAPRSGVNIHFVGVAIKDTINNGFWIGSTGGIYFYDYNTNTFSEPLPRTLTERIGGCLGAAVSKNGMLYLGTAAGFLTVDLNTVKSGIKYTFQMPERNKHETDFLNKITFILCHSSGQIYLGTNGYGLVKYNGEKYTFITTDNGLSHDIVSQLAEDFSHCIWVATSNGINCYSPETERIMNYYEQEGLCDNQFFWNGCFSSEKLGKMYFGAMHGLVEIDSKRYSNTMGSSKVFITNLSVDGHDIYPGETSILDTDIISAEEINLHESNKTLKFDFSTFNYHAPWAVVYQYKLEGYEEDWNLLSRNSRSALYTNLPSGNYVLKVRTAWGSNSFSVPKELKIHVSSYFYKRWWFILLVAAFVLFVVNTLIHWRIRSLKHQKEILEEKVNQRTSALENKSEELSRQNEILFRQNEEISRQKNQMEKMTEKIQELTVDKLAFFTNITHEFRTPLTLIIGPIERALKLSTNPKVIEQLNFVNNNSKHLLSLVNQLMDFRKVESGNMPISLKPGNFLTFLEDIILPFRALADERKVSIQSYLHFGNPYIMFDREAMTKILTNLIGNALKFTPDGGKISVYAAVLKEPEIVYLCVSDTGKGIVKDDIEKIFNSFYQSKNQDDNYSVNQQGTGIGLYVCKRLANLLGGDIFAKNNHKKGASFRMKIPLVNVETQEAAPVSSIIEGISVNEYDDSIDDQIPEDSSYRLSVLVVEDNVEMRKYIRSILSDTYAVVEASDGKNALQVLKNHTVDLILSDLMMPEMDGKQLAEAVKADINISHIPIIILTAKTSRDSQLESFRSGVDDYIIKPFDEALLKAKILTLVENRRKYQQRFKSDMDIESLNIPEDSSDKKFIDKALKIIKENYKDSEFDISELAEAMMVSKTMLNKKMQALTKQTAGQFIRNYRLKIAHDLIIKNKITRNMNISEIAYEVGFNDPKYFTRCFTKHFGTSPSSVD